MCKDESLGYLHTFAVPAKILCLKCNKMIFRIRLSGNEKSIKFRRK